MLVYCLSLVETGQVKYTVTLKSLMISYIISINLFKIESYKSHLSVTEFVLGEKHERVNFIQRMILQYVLKKIKNKRNFIHPLFYN